MIKSYCFMNLSIHMDSGFYVDTPVNYYSPLLLYMLHLIHISSFLLLCSATLNGSSVQVNWDNGLIQIQSKISECYNKLKTGSKEFDFCISLCQRKSASRNIFTESFYDRMDDEVVRFEKHRALQRKEDKDLTTQERNELLTAKNEASKLYKIFNECYKESMHQENSEETFETLRTCLSKYISFGFNLNGKYFIKDLAEKVSLVHLFYAWTPAEEKKRLYRLIDNNLIPDLDGILESYRYEYIDRPKFAKQYLKDSDRHKFTYKLLVSFGKMKKEIWELDVDDELEESRTRTKINLENMKIRFDILQSCLASSPAEDTVQSCMAKNSDYFARNVLYMNYRQLKRYKDILNEVLTGECEPLESSRNESGSTGLQGDWNYILIVFAVIGLLVLIGGYLYYRRQQRNEELEEIEEGSIEEEALTEEHQKK